MAEAEMTEGSSRNARGSDPAVHPGAKSASTPASSENLERILKRFQIFGVVLVAVTTVFSVWKILNDAIGSEMVEIRDQVKASSEFYIASADRAVRLELSSQNVNEDSVLLSSFEETVGRPPPSLRSGPLGWLLRDTVAAGYDQICEDRNFALQSHYAVADPLSQETFDQYRRSLSISTTAANRAAFAFEGLCAGRLAAAAAAAVQNIGQSEPTANVPTAATVYHFDFPVLNAEPINPRGWALDVLPCSTPRATAEAQRLAQSLANDADHNRRLGGEILGRIRLAPPGGNGKSQIFYDPGEKNLAIALQIYANNITGSQYNVTVNAGPVTKWYLGIYVCP